MRYEFFIARRHLFSRKSHHAINIISTISALGVAIATTAMVCTLSVFNGFRGLVSDLFTAFDPEIRVSLQEGQTVRADDPRLLRLKQSPLIKVYTPCLMDQAMIMHEGQQYIATIMGVSDNFRRQSSIDGILYGPGEFALHADVLEYGIMGIQLASEMGLSAQFENPLQVYAPRPGARMNMANPLSSFTHDELQSPGVVFMVKQSKYDDRYVITSLAFAQRLFSRPGQLSQVLLRLRDGVSTAQAKREFKSILGPSFRIEDRYEQQADVFRIMKVEKLLSYIFLTFILLIASFNIIGSMSMLMIDKKPDTSTLIAMGATPHQLSRIFMLEGFIISLSGAVLGILLGLILCLLQQQFGLLSMGDSEGNFIIEAYPVSVQASDILLVLLTVVVTGWAAVWYPVRKMTRRLFLQT